LETKAEIVMIGRLWGFTGEIVEGNAIYMFAHFECSDGGCVVVDYCLN